MSLRDKVAIVTGATGGIGNAITLRLLAEGMVLVLAGRSRDWQSPRRGALPAWRYHRRNVRQVPHRCSGRAMRWARRPGQLSRPRFPLGLRLHGHRRGASGPGGERPGDLADDETRCPPHDRARRRSDDQHRIPSRASGDPRAGGLWCLKGGHRPADPRGGNRPSSPRHPRELHRPGMTRTEMIAAWVRGQSDPSGFEQGLTSSIPLGRMAEPDEIARGRRFLGGRRCSLHHRRCAAGRWWIHRPMREVDMPTEGHTPTPLMDDTSYVPAVWARYTNIVVRHGEGSWLVSNDGRRYLDYSSGIGVTSTGHAHPRVVAAVQAQAAKLLHGQQNIVFHEPGLELYRRLSTASAGRSLASILVKQRRRGSRSCHQACARRDWKAGDHPIPIRIPRTHWSDDGTLILAGDDTWGLRAASGLRVPCGLSVLLSGSGWSPSP